MKKLIKKKVTIIADAQGTNLYNVWYIDRKGKFDWLYSSKQAASECKDEQELYCTIMSLLEKNNMKVKTKNRGGYVEQGIYYVSPYDATQIQQKLIDAQLYQELKHAGWPQQSIQF